MFRCQGCSGTAPFLSNCSQLTWTHNLTEPDPLLLNWILFSAGGSLLQNTAINVNNAASPLSFNWHILPLIVCITEDKRIQAHEAHLHNEGIWCWDQQQCSSQLSTPAHTALGCFFSLLKTKTNHVDDNHDKAPSYCEYCQTNNVLTIENTFWCKKSKFAKLYILFIFLEIKILSMFIDDRIFMKR